ncbi:MAG: oligosaccharide MFS transporter [Bacillota bacterium]
MDKVPKGIYIRLCAFFFFFQLTWAAGYSLFAIWLGEVIELDSVSIGIIISVNAVFALCFKIFYGYLLDKIGLRKNVLWTISLLTVFVGPFFIYIYGPLLKTNLLIGTIVGGFYLGVTYLAGIAAIESYLEKCGRKYNFEYGETRMWGSLGWAAAIFFAGQLYNIDPNINFWIATCCALVLVLVLATLKIDVSIEEVEKSQSLKLNDIVSLFKMKSFWIFVMYVVGVVWSYFIMEQQFPRYFVTLFSDQALGKQVYGYLGSATVFLEAGMLFTAPFIINKIGPKKGLILAGVIMVIRIIGSGLAVVPVGISVIKLLHAFVLPILLVSIFKYIAANFDPRLASSMYLIGYQSMLYVGIATFGPFSGKLYDTIGFDNTYILLGCVTLVFTIISCFTLSNKRVSDEGELEKQQLAS